MLRARFTNILAGLTFFLALSVQAQPASTEPADPALARHVGLSYFTFFNGPGLNPDNLDFCPNNLGKASNDGINTQNKVSLKWKFSKKFALDFQARFYLILNKVAG